jgi:hypothetical protein
LNARTRRACRQQSKLEESPEFANNDPLTASIELIVYAMKLVAERADELGVTRQAPRDVYELR